MGLKAYRVNIIGLSNKVHEFDFEIGRPFFEHYGSNLVSDGQFEAKATLDKRETFIEVRLLIEGTATLICDRSLDPFQQPIRVDKKIVFKYGDHDEELTDEIVIMNRETDSLDLGQYMYEFIALEVPYKKLHPRYKGEPDVEDEEGKIIYSSGADKDSGEDDEIDPRWEKLKKLK